MWSFVALSALDAYQTMNAPAGSREGNPLLSSWAGDHPSTGETLLFKAAATYGLVKLTNRLKRRKTRKWVLILLNSVQLSVTIHNERASGRIIF